VLVLWLLPLLSAWLRVRRIRFRSGAGAVVVVDASELPAELEPLFAEATKELEALGFAYTHAQWSDSISRSEPRRPGRVFVHAETSTYAVVGPAVFHNGRRLYSVAFTTTFRSGHVLTTVDAVTHLTPVLPPLREWRDDYLNDVGAQWAGHRAAVEKRAQVDSPVRPGPEEFARQEQAALASFVERGWRDGLFRYERDASPRLTALAAWRFGRRLLEGARRVARMERDRRSASGSREAWLASEVYAFTVADAYRPEARPMRAKALLFVASGVVSAVAIGVLFSWQMVPVLFAVLLVHELGHLAGMWLFGFRDRQMLFLPLLGAAALGRKEDATATQKLIVLLLGPVPGLALGAVCLWLGARTGSPVWHEIGITAVVLNYVNLLPVTPLDGGRVVELLFLQRMPLAGAAFLLASAVVAGLAGLAFGDGVVIGLSVLMLVAVPARWRVGAAVHGAARRLPARPARLDRVRAAFLALDERVDRAAVQVRLQLARSVVEHLEARPVTAALSLGGGALYALLLAVPVGGALSYEAPAPRVTDMCAWADGRAATDVASDYGRALVEVCRDGGFRRLDAEDQWTMLLSHARTHLAEGDSATGAQYLRLASTAAAFEFDFTDARAVETRELLIRVEKLDLRP
jgi:Zn-dependent protease